MTRPSARIATAGNSVKLTGINATPPDPNEASSEPSLLIRATTPDAIWQCGHLH
jgi:hypothetical protein